jgi:predicted ArsR family transcriptional regulator
MATMDSDTFDQQVSGIAALDHPLSRQAYRLVLDEGWVSRDAAAEALDVARSVAAFHLDKLVDAGLLEARYERISGRTGPGAGRPAKLYGRSSREIGLSLPPRRYDLASSLLADAVTSAASQAIPVEQAVSQVARATGKRLGSEAVRGRKSARRAALMDVLARHGYEPRKRGREIALLNCPFHTIAAEHRELVCGMNLDFLMGVLDGTGGETLQARLAPEPGYCCVRLSQQ